MEIKLENILLYTITNNNKCRAFTSINLDINKIHELRRELDKKNLFRNVLKIMWIIY